MSDTPPITDTMVIQSSRFGEFTVPTASIIEFSHGMIGFAEAKRYVLLDHKPPFSWLHSVDNPHLAFVVVDGGEFGENYQVKAPIGDPAIDLRPEDEFALLVVVTVRPDPSMTSANLKAPLFVNLRNRKGVQIVLDDQRYSTRFLLWAPQAEPKIPPEPEKSPK